MMSVMSCSDAPPDGGVVMPSLVRRPALPEGPFLVAGLGRAGQAAAHALSRAMGSERVRTWDADTGAGMQRLRRLLERQGIQTTLSERPTSREVEWARTVVKSPGIPFDSSVIQRALAKGREVIDELELGWRLSSTPTLAVTGTNGKSSVCGLATAVLSAAGLRVRLAGNTQFGPCLSTVASESPDWIVCEVSSFQLEGCVQMLPELAVFTNLAPEHLGRHGTIERYGALKRRLFVHGGVAVSRAIVDIDSPFGRRLASEIEHCGGVVTRVGFSAAADYRVQSAAWDLRRAETHISTPTGRISLLTALPGPYNARNVAAALAIADLTGVERWASVPALSANVGPPGRFEHVDAGQPFEVIVDFAHTRDALEQLLETTRVAMRPGAALRVAFGIGGVPGNAFHNMGRVARQLSDQLILTTSGFRGTPPVLTLGSVLAGARSVFGGELEVILNRRRAIERAVLSARPDDVVVIPGRGALTDMRADPRGEPVPFDDRQVAREIVQAVVAARGRTWESGPNPGPVERLVTC